MDKRLCQPIACIYLQLNQHPPRSELNRDTHKDKKPQQGHLRTSISMQLNLQQHIVPLLTVRAISYESLACKPTVFFSTFKIQKYMTRMYFNRKYHSIFIILIQYTLHNAILYLKKYFKYMHWEYTPSLSK